MSEASPTPAQPGYRPVPASVDLPAMEHQVLARWRADGTFAATLAQGEGAPEWTFYEGPPTANGTPGTHHIEARVFKDVFPRFKTMQGHHVDRKGGWDCHGLPVELAVEKELGLNGKPDIEAYGIEAFNARCREAVLRNVDQFEQLTTRMGYWVDTEHPYRTMDASYVESVWWALKQVFESGLLVEDFRVAPYCPRCGTGLSDHELAQGYETVVDPSVYVRLPLTSGPLAGTADLLIWTTTPWTLPSNALVAVKDDVEYVVATQEGQTPVVVAASLLDHALGEGWQPDEEHRFTGAEMVGWRYRRPFEVVDWSGDGHFVVTEDYVTTEDGTGLVHQATVFGADDFDSVRRHGVELVNPIDTRGRFLEATGLVGGLYFREANAPLMEDLGARGLLFRHLDYEHSYPHCWRCHSALMYYALPSWYIRTTRVKDALLRENEATTWYPGTIKHGRYGDWLTNNIDWALSRLRYWGTPLPIWRNDADPSQLRCVASLAELSELTGRDLSELDPHRPFIDDVTFTVDGVPGTFRRVPEVIDAWFDSGSMPFAQHGYPHLPGSVAAFEKAYPADFISEAIDQTRGWFYTLMAIGTLVFDRSSYRTVVCLGHILAEDGRKMSKHLGNILDPIDLMDTHGADAVRWFMAAGGSPWAARRVGHQSIGETVRKVLLTYWNSVSFQALYARANGWTPTGDAPAVSQRHVLDRWLTSQTQTLVRQVTEALEDFDTQRAGTLLADFVDGLSNWYVRRSRRRFWDGSASALWTLHETLDTLTRLMAPLAPFVTERVWDDLFVASGTASVPSVHQASWPVADPGLVQEGLAGSMALARRVVELGRAARAEARMKIRQPLRRVLVPSATAARLDEELTAEITAELNLGAVEAFGSAGDLVDHTAKGNFRVLGKRYGKQTPVVAAAVAGADASALAAALAGDGRVELEVPGVGAVELGPGDVLLTERPCEGWSVVNEQGETVALDLHLTPELVRAGLAREAVRLVQEARKDSGFEVSDRIELAWAAEGELAAALVEHADLVAGEVLATRMTRADPGPGWRRSDELGLSFEVQRV